MGFIGLGNMGASMAANISRNPELGKGLVVYDIAPKSIEQLSKQGVRAARSVAELAASSDIIVTMVVLQSESTAT